ncbi:SMP-30/gluconolactonase/LRE family protein [Phycisphaera mikurensis]|uniref:Putative gluconolactonase n=1 Tax=Phycisphaera mikurensis (strain NBRC 102666 / KCTC 22515 / FYK2301M01) TaxID=1142394 RepID=I0IHR4_PHYMF|nr:SMP-30/gluconolactonase/LRE family protein [Phycisphaera mikurensis]MBB6441046.1 D-xylonolactonase [Phycisphaera mikurensis]BAM04802.1 putative gluconolactonase [Phycisphaera mikurensis NBRC 102666]
MDAPPNRPVPARRVAQTGCACGENPLWHPDERALYWIDIVTGRLFRLATEADGTPAAGAVPETVRTGPPVGAASLEADGALLLLGAEGHVQRFDGGRQTTVHEGLCPGTRFNDCLADPAGRLFSGTMSNFEGDGADMTGKLLRLDPDGSTRVVDEGFGIPNGMGFTPDGRHLYLTDTTPGRIYRYAYDPATGDLTDRAVFFEEAGCGCDGMAMDEAGRLWSARWGGRGVWEHDPATGEASRAIELPVDKVTAIAFAGSGLATACVTTAGGNPEDPASSPEGALFVAEMPGVRGAPRHRSRIACG